VSDADLRRLWTALYGDDITKGDIPYLKAKDIKQDGRLTRLEFLLILAVGLGIAQGVGSLLGGITA
jgi:hypothetical protein